MNNIWQQILEDKVIKNKISSILSSVNEQRKLGVAIYPSSDEVFNCFTLCPFEKTKVVIIGQDPYHQPNQANGLAFSVKEGIKLPPSLRNIFKEYSSDLSYETPSNGDLSKWAKQGCLLINSTLTVEDSKPNSHFKLGWSDITDYVIKYISDNKDHVVFVLLGKFAEEKKHLINGEKHSIIITSHPSPFSARKGFFNSKIFTKINNKLKDHNQKPIDWRLS